MVLPSGKRRQMESQDYLQKATASSEIVESMLRKLAALDINRDPAQMANTLSAPKEPMKPEMKDPAGMDSGMETPQTGASPEQAPTVGDVMNQSNGLPQQQNEVMVVGPDGRAIQTEQGKMAMQILEMLAQKGFGEKGTFVLKAFDLSNGFSMTAVPKAGPAVAK